MSSENGNQGHTFILRGIPFEAITEVIIAKNAAVSVYFNSKDYQLITPIALDVNQGTFTHQHSTTNFPPVTIIQQNGQLVLRCQCLSSANKLCEHEAHVLAAIVKRDELGIFFNQTLRHQKLKRLPQITALKTSLILKTFLLLITTTKG